MNNKGIGNRLTHCQSKLWITGPADNDAIACRLRGGQNLEWSECENALDYGDVVEPTNRRFQPIPSNANVLQ